MDLTALRQELATLHTAGETLIKTATDAKRDFTAEEKTASDAQFSRMTEIKSILDRNAKLAEFSFANQGDPAAATVQTPTEPAGRAERDAVEIHVGTTFDMRRFDHQTYNRLVSRYLSGDQLPRQFMRTIDGAQESRLVLPFATAKELQRRRDRYATITGSTQSGILMPTDVLPPITPMALNAFREALEAYGMDSWKTPSTRNINLPIYTSSAGAVASGTATTESEQEPALTESISSVIKNYMSENVWFENRDLAALDYDLLGATVPAMHYAKELALESDIITTVTGDSNVTGNGYEVTTSVSGGLTFAYADFVSLNRTLPKRYQTNKVIVLSKSAYAAAENMTTTTGFPLLNQDAQNQQLKRFNGTPVVYSEYLAAMGAAAIVGLIFSWIGCRLRDAGEGDILQRFTQTATRQGQTGACLYGYHCFSYTPNSVALFKTHA